MSIAARNAILAGGAAPGPTPAYWGLCFTAEEAGSTVAMAKSGSAPAVTLEYSLDGTSWETFTAGTTTVTLAQIGDCVYLRAGEGGNRQFGKYTNVTSHPYWRFSLSGQFSVSGNITSILNQSGVTDSSGLLTATFYSLFRNCTALTSAALLQIPLQDLKGGACREMFYGCTSLVSAPEISAATMGYAATTSGSCYQMFYGCTALTTAPSLPATTLASSCYSSMFRGCTGLTAAPSLPATTLASSCYSSMFRGCTSLATVRTAQTQAWGDGSTTDPTYQWLDGVAATGTFYCPTALGTNETIERGTSRCPTGWTVINTDA